MSHPVKAPKKLIEVSLPLDDINAAAAREKSIRHGHPSTLHLWWARRPLAAARAVIFAQLVNDPSWKWEMEHAGEVPPSQLKASWASSRKRLFTLISELVKWENTTNEELLKKAHAEIRKSWRETCEINKEHPEAAELFNPEKLPGLHDPFAGGGAIPLEAQRLGLEAFASDLNPVAVLINKAMIEIPPRFAGRPPVHPDAQQEAKLKTWKGARGLAEDVRRYGAWMRDEAERRIGHLYPNVEVTAEMAEDRPDLKGYVGRELTVIAWLWARTVKSPNPAFGDIDVPLVSTFLLRSKGADKAWVEPLVSGHSYSFHVGTGSHPPPEATLGTKPARANFKCIMSGAPIDATYIRSEAQAGRMGVRLLAIVAAAGQGRVYVSADQDHERVALAVHPPWKPDLPVTTPCHDIDRLPMYGMLTWGDAFTARQATFLANLVDLLGDVRARVEADHRLVGLAGASSLGLDEGGDGSKAYGEAISVYLASAISKVANVGSSVASWMNDRGAFRETFSRQAIQMVWDFVEANPLADAGGSLGTALEKGAMALDMIPTHGTGLAVQADASTQTMSKGRFVSTDPPYYDNIGYADLSDFFYVWLRPGLRAVFPSLFATIAVPKAEELVASPYRHGSKADAEKFFLDGMTKALGRVARDAHSACPVTIYYAFKQSETRGNSGTSSSGWETFLGALLRAGFELTGTWPMRTEGAGRLVARNTNSLASSIVLVCRKRAESAPTVSRRQFIRELNTVLPEALDEMTMGAGADQSPVAPVDLSQAIIGPGMAVFSKYAAVLEADGTPMSVKTALQLINRFFAEDDFDADTQFCLRWFEQHGWNEGQYGEADVLARAKATSVGGVVDSGVLFSGGGKVRLRRWADYPDDWDPRTDKRLPVWEGLHQLIRAFKTDGESGSGAILGVIKDKTEAIRQLAYRLYTLCERRGWAEDARAYNELVTSWSAIETVANAVPDPHATEQLGLDFGGKR